MRGVVKRVVVGGVVAVACVLALTFGASDAMAQSDAGATGGDAGAASSGGDVAPRISHRVEATYPPDARNARIEGEVLLELTIGVDGHVRDVTVVQPAGHGFDEAALAAVRQFEYTPARRDGAAIEARIRYRYRFRLPRAGTGTPTPAAPVAVVRGVLRNRGDQPIEGATVILHRTGRDDVRRTSDASGAFRFELDAPGQVSLEVTAEGYETFRSDESPNAGDDLQFTFRLSQHQAGGGTQASAGGSGGTGASASASGGNPASTSGGTGASGAAGTGGSRGTGGGTRAGGTTRNDDDEQSITVRASRPQREVVRTTLDRRELERVPGTGGDALRALTNLPGVARPPFIGGVLLVRGSAPFDTQTFVDGTSVPLIYHFGGLASVVPTEMLDRIDFYPGNYSARFGRAMGGIVDVGIREPRRRGWHGVADVSAAFASLYLEGAISPNVSFAVAARRSYVDLFLNAILSGFANVPAIASPVFWDYQGVLDWHINPRHRVRLLLMGSDDALNVLFRQSESSEPQFASGFNFGNRFHFLQLSWQGQLGQGISNRLMISTGWTNIDFNGGDFRFGIHAFPTNVRYEYTHQVSNVFRANAGLDMQVGAYNLGFRLARPDGGGGVVDTNNTMQIATDFQTPFLRPALYFEGEVTPIRQLRIVPGVRADYFHDIRGMTISPRLSVRGEITRWLALRGGVGLFTQGPQPQESLAAPNTFFPGQTIGNPNLRPQRAMHYTVGAEFTFSPYVSLTVDGFVKNMEDLVRQTPVRALLNTPPPPTYTNDLYGRVVGLEVLLRHRPSSRFFGWIAYTLMLSERCSQDCRGDNPVWRLFASDQTHIFTALGTFRLGAGWEIGARWRYVTGSPFTPIIGSRPQTGTAGPEGWCPRTTMSGAPVGAPPAGSGAIFNGDNGSYSPVSDSPSYCLRLPDFHQLDIRIDKTFQFRTWRLSFYLDVWNVYNRGNPEGTNDSYNFREYQFISGLPILPNLGIRGEF